MNHEIYMRRCLDLASAGLAAVVPNPMVGAVLVYNDEIIGEGFHRSFGGPHAEVHAIKAVKKTAALSEATLYVNLEPCAHHGKTPPCADLILQMGIPHVVVANRDPFEKVDGKGIERLRSHGVNVVEGVLEKEGRFLNRRFFTFHEKKRPYIHLKWAQSEDGFLDRTRINAEKGSQWITGKEAKRIVHQWRSEEMGILVGMNTVVNDDPQLSVREYLGRQPIRFIIGDARRIALNAHVNDGSVRTVCFSSHMNAELKNIEIHLLQLGQDPAEALLDFAYNENIQSLFVEGGATLLQYFIDRHLWDEAHVFTGKKVFASGLKAPIIEKHSAETRFVGADQLVTYYNL